MSDIKLTEKYEDILESTKFPKLSQSDKSVMSILLENTAKDTEKILAEANNAADVAQFTPIMMPLVRRVFPNLIANELLGIQPMTMPTGYIYALVNRYTGNSDTTKITPANSGVVLELDDVTGVNIGDAVTGGGANGKVAHVDKKNKRILVVVTTGTFAVGALTAPAGKNVKAVYTNEANFHRVLENYTGPYTTAAGELLAKDMNTVGFDVMKKSVEVKTRKLKAEYTLEMYDDLKAQHGLLADEELMSLMSAELQAEIDREIVNFVNDNATVLPNIAYKPNAADGRWEIEKYRVEAIKMSNEAKNIGLLTKRGQANIILCSPKVATMLEQIGTFKFADSSASIDKPLYNGLVGTFDGKYKVVVDQYATSDYITMLYKGSDRRDSIGFFSPYVPASFQRLINPDSGQPSIILRSRYGLDTTPLDPQNYARTWGVDFSQTGLGY